MKRGFIRSKQKAKISEGAMADVAFLLLIFFMVSTVIFNDQGIRVTLPQYENRPARSVSDGLEIGVFLNEQNEILIEDRTIHWHQAEHVIEGFLNQSQRNRKTVIVINAHRGARYEDYNRLYDILQVGIRQFWEQKAEKDYHLLSKDEMRELKTSWPIAISESE